MNTSSPLAELLQAATELVEAHWNQKHTAMLLSTLGHQLSARGLDVPKLLQGRKLSEALRDGADQLSVQRVREDSPIMGVLPKSAGGQAATALAELASSRTGATHDLPRLSPVIWAAFTKPLAAGKARFIRLEPLNFVDEARGAEANELVVTSSEIMLRGDLAAAEHSQKAFDSVKEWASHNGVPFESLLFGRPTKATSSINTKSALERMVAVLSHEQKKRLMLPMDIVETLLKS